MNMIDKLRSLADEITRAKDPLKAQEAWTLVGRLIGRTPADPAAAAEVVERQDVAGLRAILDGLEGKSAPAAAPPPGPAQGASAYSADDLAGAMRAFKKRLKLVRLNDESRLGGRQLSGGRKSEVDAIPAPSDYPQDVWKELARRGRLVDTGGGFYMLPE